MKNIKDRTGEKRGRLTAIKLLTTRKYPTSSYDWLFKCDCGNFIARNPSEIFRKDIDYNFSCGCSRLPGNDHPSFKGFESIPLDTFTKVKRRAINCNKEFDISIEYLDELFKKQEGKCKISGKELHFKHRCPTASLDRIDSSKGYIEGNVQWTHKRVNVMKMDMSDNELIEWCKTISEYNIKAIRNIK